MKYSGELLRSLLDAYMVFDEMSKRIEGIKNKKERRMLINFKNMTFSAIKASMIDMIEHPALPLSRKSIYASWDTIEDIIDQELDSKTGFPKNFPAMVEDLVKSSEETQLFQDQYDDKDYYDIMKEAGANIKKSTNLKESTNPITTEEGWVIKKAFEEEEHTPEVEALLELMTNKNP